MCNCGERSTDTLILRYDNHHGVHERHEGDDVDEIEFPGYEPLLRRFAQELPDEAALARLLSARNLELLRAIASEDPESIRALARTVDRDVKNVSTALDDIEALGLVEFERDGQAKRPTIWYDDIEIAVDLRSGASGEEATPV